MISTDRPPTSEQWRRAAGHPRSGGTRNALVRRSHCGQASSASRRAGKASGSDAASTFGFLISLVPGEVRTQALPQFSRCRRQPSASLVSRPGQSFLQLLLLLVPTGFLRLRSLFDRGAVGLDGGRTLVALLLGLFKCGLRLVDCLLAPLTLLFVCWLFLPTAGLLSLSLESQRRLPPGFIVALPRRCFGLFRVFLDLRLPSPGRSVGSSASSLKGPSDPDWPPENHAGVGHGRGHDVGIVNFLRGALVEKIALRPHASRVAFIDGRSDCLVEEAQRGLIGLQFSRHEPRRSCRPTCAGRSRSRRCCRSFT